MTPNQREKYWRVYARQNAKMERLAFYIMLRSLKQCVDKVSVSVREIGAERTLLELDSIFLNSAIKEAYDNIYYRVGQSQKKWSDADVKTRFQRKGRKEEERNPFNLQPIRVPKPKPPVIEPVITPSFGVGFFNPAWLARLRGIVNGFDVGQRVTSVSDTVKKQIRKSLEESVQQFVSPRKIISKLRRDVGGLFSRQRAEVIARTEVTFIANVAARQSAEETGLKLKKGWIHTRDDRTRDSHRGVSTKLIDSWDKFLVGGYLMDGPGDPTAPLKEIISCRCIRFYVPADDYEDLGF